jgi:hypothetical protein
MTDLILTTFDWVPEPPRGYVRDIRVLLDDNDIGIFRAFGETGRSRSIGGTRPASEQEQNV